MTTNDPRLSPPLSVAGNVLDKDFKSDDALREGVVITGAGPNRQLISGATVSGAWMRTASTATSPSSPTRCRPPTGS